MNKPLSSPPPRKWACPSGSREPKEDDQEVTFPGGGRWGPLRQPTPAVEQPAGGRVPSGPPQWPRCPALAGSDMGQLITALTLGLCIGTHKINTFSSNVTPGKTEVLYEQWNHKVQCIKDHYLELVVWESIMRSLKGAAADMAQYMGPTASVSDILKKFSVIFGTIASFDMLMENIYKITQGSSKKVPLFTTRLEGTLNQIRLRCPGQIANCEVPWHLKEQLFHRVRKHMIPLGICMAIPRPPTLSSWSQHKEWTVRWKRQKKGSRWDQLLLQRCPLAQKSWGTK